jgi:anti-anti-sigma factor
MHGGHPPRRLGQAGHGPDTVPFAISDACCPSGTYLLRLAGELDVLTCPLLDAHLDQRLRQVEWDCLIVDLSHVSFCGAAGVHSLLRARRLADARGAELRLVAAGSPVRRVLELTGAATWFRIDPDVGMADSDE